MAIFCMIAFYICLLIVIIYAMLLFRWMIGWIIYSSVHLNSNALSPEKISVVVAVRNEEKEILNCLNALNNQVSNNFEILISDDFSEDLTREIVKKFIDEKAVSKKDWKLIEAAEGNLTGKKAALERAIKLASGNLLLTTDADCTMGKFWVQSFSECFQQTQASMITGFVCLQPGKKLIEKFQAFEFISLSGIGATSVILEKPLMCNGANLAFTRAAFYNAGGYSYGGSLPSGDDTFLMLQFLQAGKKVVFNKNYDGIVTSKPAVGLRQLFFQRKRWASKVRFYKEGYIKRIGAFLFVVNGVLLAALVLGVLNYFSWKAVAGLWCIKLIADLLFLIPVSRFSHQQQLLLLFLPAAIIYPFYALAGMFFTPGKVSYSWKGRDYTIRQELNE